MRWKSIGMIFVIEKGGCDNLKLGTRRFGRPLCVCAEGVGGNGWRLGVDRAKEVLVF